MAKLFAVAFFLCVLILNADETGSLISRLDGLETTIYGQVRLNESIDSRISRLETIVFGKIYDANSLESRLTRLVKPFYPDLSDQNVSIFIKAGYLEWLMNSKVTPMPALSKISRLKKMAIGDASLTDPLIFEVSKLCSVALEGNRLVVELVKLPADVEMLAVLKDRIHSRHIRRGDSIEMELKKDVFVDDTLVFPAGTKITGKITRARRARMFGKNGRINIGLETIQGFDQREYSFTLEQMNLSTEDNTGMAAGVTLLGLAAFGPVGAVGGLFVKGKDVVIESGTEFHLKVNIPDSVPGIIIKEKN